MSSASHGVKLRPLDTSANIVFGTIPLLSPTMEFDLLKETWPAADLFDKPNMPKTTSTTTTTTTSTRTNAEEENSVLSIWEENYQDLSDWCIDTFQGQCAIPIGEFDINKYSGTKSEDSGVSIKRAGSSGKVSRDLVDEKVSLAESNLKLPEHPAIVTNTKSQMEDSKHEVKTEIIDNRTTGKTNDVLLDPIDSSINLKTDDWIQLNNVNGLYFSSITVQHDNHEIESDVISAEYPIAIPLEIAKDEKDDWDTTNTECETFDLLSYLCDDNIQSPDGSIVSRDSGPTNASMSSVASQPEEGSSSTRDLRNDRRNYVDASATSSSSSFSAIAAISAALDSVAKMSERSSRDREKRERRSSRREYKDSGRTRGRGKKRCHESDSEDRTSDDSYRETREKNNEASRKSRMNKKAKENEMMRRASELERDNRILRMKVDELDKLVTSMRTAILRSALKKNS